MHWKKQIYCFNCCKIWNCRWYSGLVDVMAYLCNKWPRMCFSCHKHFPHSWLINRFVTIVTRGVPLVEQELLPVFFSLRKYSFILGNTPFCFFSLRTYSFLHLVQNMLIFRNLWFQVLFFLLINFCLFIEFLIYDLSLGL